MSPWINAKGTPLVEVTDDIDGDARDGSTPDIGADEYTPPGGVTPPLAGPYTIGAGGDYTTFALAVDALLHKTTLSVTGFAVLRVYRIGGLEFVENQQSTDKVYSAGSLYRLTVEKT